jgi:hypothetical protein
MIISSYVTASWEQSLFELLYWLPRQVRNDLARGVRR